MEGIPVEIKVDIFTYLKLHDFYNASLVCKNWNTILFHSPETLTPWRHLVARDFNIHSKPAEQQDETWMNIYKDASAWTWSDQVKNKLVVLSEKNRVATVTTNNSTFYLAALSSNPLTFGTYFIEISVLYVH